MRRALLLLLGLPLLTAGAASGCFLFSVLLDRVGIPLALHVAASIVFTLAVIGAAGIIIEKGAK